MIWGLIVGGGAAPFAIGDPGPLVRWGLPAATLVVNLCAAGMVGALVTALFALKAGEREFDAALDLASVSAAIFTVAAASTGFLTFVNTFNPAWGLGPEFGAQLGRFLIETEAGRTWLITAIAGAAITVLTFAVRSWTPTLFVAILAIAALVPMGTQGHSGEEANHSAAVMALVLHIIAAAVWLGGLLLMVVIRPLTDRQTLADAMARYSTFALAAFVVVAISGTVRAVIGVGAWQNLASPYGVILLAKVGALLVLGILGAWYRKRLIGRMREDPASRHFWGLIALELAFMGLASGAAVALARTAPPTTSNLPAVRTPAEILAGSPLPPELTLDRWLTSWNLDLLWAFAAGFGIFLYVAGALRLRRRGDGWPIYRTVLWITGLVLLFWVTCGPINAYGEYLFSVHMVGHMLLTMAIPVLLVAGAPVTLAARAIRKRDDGTRGGREWILWAVHTPVARVLTHPFVAAGLFVGSLWVFYFTDLFRWSLYDHLGHEWMTAHFLITGYLFVLSLIGIDPVAYRLPYAGRLVTLIAVMAIHAFFGIAIMMQSGLMVAEWFGAMGRTWGASPLEDQYIGGGVAWSIGELPTLILAITVAIQWSRSDERAQRSADRHADRSGDAELEAYNAQLAALAERDARG
ncbi:MULTISPECIES: bifunctional copper resistance protein CopD/cytochrome c oxidase assembly protein [unclassified Microbacterium]|uniref:bifunctional copper resistance protein CopD/cytochrome c oxidase assembly protein n=1 Tax=unclassified Microbacterium TaxID=2609290 RepID=UPI00214C0910|nr:MULTISPECIES: bifunctional copper resistance protein CopD/cytochrome c oxidase assembly protein [unclassified Microbacterium]MCR2808359.1 bifunctional copper resistance protein CopD/cytochrome c oxidase assembly protein [Microbacterium sp. zg.B185]WIM20930.1 bifunctional copper resistance protein CopD/cytochrome c oxidase assembly protein [Microbacterium sp. zg-B185]